MIHLDSLANDLSVYGYSITENVFSQGDFNLLLKSFLGNQGKMRPAFIGKGKGKVVEATIRNDYMSWLEEGDETLELLGPFLNKAREVLRKDLYLPIKRYEAQMALYPEGHFYKRHKDKHQKLSSRLISMVLYFNNWSEGDGGELMIYPENKPAVKVRPVMNKVVFFLSELEHEVLPTLKDRRSVAVWFRDDVE